MSGPFAASKGSKSSGGSKWSVSLIRNKRRSDCNVPPFDGNVVNLALATVRICHRLRTVRHRGSSIEWLNRSFASYRQLQKIGQLNDLCRLGGPMRTSGRASI